MQSILLTSIAPQHVLINASWLLGSAGTIFLDSIGLSSSSVRRMSLTCHSHAVLGQFYYYSSARKSRAKIFANDENTALLDDDDA